MVTFDPNALIQDILSKTKRSPGMPPEPTERSEFGRVDLQPAERSGQRQGHLMSKLGIINNYAPGFESEDRYLDMADEMMFRANQINQQAALTRATRPVNFSGGPEIVGVPPVSPRSAVQNVQGKMGKGTPVAKGDFGRFAQAIAGKESGGSYKVVNKDSGAMGKYQIMPSNITGPGGWDKEIIGKNVTPQQFLNNPQIQDAIALGKLRQYYNKYGVRGAASAWYSGDPNKWRNTSPQGGYPSINAYVMDILRRMGMG